MNSLADGLWSLDLEALPVSDAIEHQHSMMEHDPQADVVQYTSLSDEELGSMPSDFVVVTVSVQLTVVIIPYNI